MSLTENSDIVLVFAETDEDLESGSGPFERPFAPSLDPVRPQLGPRSPIADLTRA
jgi:hypothetical protein